MDEEAPNVQAIVTTGVPPISIKLSEGTTICHEGESYSAGDEVEMPGPMAQHFVALGYATFVGWEAPE